MSKTDVFLALTRPWPDPPACRDVYGRTTSSEMTTGRLLVTPAGVGMPALGPGEPPGPTGRLPAGIGIPGETTVPPWH